MLSLGVHKWIQIHFEGRSFGSQGFLSEPVDPQLYSHLFWGRNLGARGSFLSVGVHNWIQTGFGERVLGARGSFLHLGVHDWIQTHFGERVLGARVSFLLLGIHTWIETGFGEGVQVTRGSFLPLGIPWEGLPDALTVPVTPLGHLPHPAPSPTECLLCQCPLSWGSQGGSSQGGLCQVSSGGGHGHGPSLQGPCCGESRESREIRESGEIRAGRAPVQPCTPWGHGWGRDRDGDRFRVTDGDRVIDGVRIRTGPQ